MGLTTNFNKNPYWDDFNEDKNFHKVLFKPAVAVQARELTQLQTILQNQIERFGENVIKEGSIVKGGNFVEVNPLPYVKVLDRVYDVNNEIVTSVNVSAFVGLKAVGQDSGIEAIVVETAAGNQTTAEETKTLFVKYLNNNQVSGVNRNVFDDSEEIFLLDPTTLQRQYTVTAGGATTAGTTGSVGNGYGVRCGEGVIFQKGHFTRFYDDLTIVSRYTTTPSDVVVGFKTIESVVDSNEDSSLLDNAQGYNNYNAPGADRLKLTPVLTAVTSAEAKADPTFFSLQEYQNGRVIRRRLTTQFNSVEKLVEQRTAEESGNYTVNDFKVKMEQSTSNTSLLAVNVSPGIAYVEGKRVEIVNNFNIEIPEPSVDDAIEVTGQSITTNYGHYILTSDDVGIRFNIAAMEQVNLYSNADLMGTARIRNLTKQSDGKYRLYLFAIEVGDGYQFSDLTSVRSSGNPTDGNVVITDTTLYDYNFRSAVYPIGRDFIKDIDPVSTYTYREIAQNVTVDGSGNITIDISDVFPYGVGSLNSDQLLDFVVVNQNLGEDVTVVSGSQVTDSRVTLVVSSSSITVDVYYNAVKDGVSSINTKTIGTYYVKINTAALGNTGPYCLGMPDVASIEQVLLNGTTDVTSSFRLDNGQRDSYYGLSYLRKIDAYNFAGGTLTVAVRAFRHTDGASYFCVNSYPVDDTTVPLPSNKIRTEDIPSYITEAGNTLYLRDAIDFRPHASNTVVYATSAGAATTINSTTYEALAFDGAKIGFPAPNELINLTYNYNIGRYDRLIIDENGEFNVLLGVPADDPVVPAEPNKGMSLAVLKIPPFPSVPMSVALRAGKPDYGIAVVPVKNKRYTMKDIGKIESRIKTLEYYTSLNLLEKKTKDLIITDGNGVDRFKNGIMVDNFENLAIGRTANPEFSAAVDPSFKELMPRFRSYPISLKPTGVGSSFVDYGIAATLDKTDVLIMEQPYATSMKSCTTDYYKYNGAMTIYPTYDSAPDVTRAPDINIEIDLATPFIEYTEILSEFVPLQNVTEEVVASTVARSRRTTTDTVQITTDTMTVTEGTTDTQALGDFVTDLQFEPFLRAKDIEVYVTGLRPNTRFYFYFDGKDVNDHVAAGTLITPTGEGAYVAPSSEFGTTDPIVSDSNGVLSAVFRIPAETFFVGDRLLEVFDLPLYTDKANATSYASHNYSGFNFSVTKTGMTVSTRQPRIAISTDIDFDTRTRRSGGSDPIAQTFAIDVDQSNDTSVMITKADLFFARKSNTNNGVTVAIVETVNGVPSAKIVPFSEVHLSKDEISANEDTAVLATTVTFKAPVALKTNVEYAIVIAPDANDPDYFVWVSKTGGVDVDSGEAVTQDTNAGVLFTSTNAKAWTPYQDENMKFNLYRAEFQSATGYVELTTNDVEFLRVDNVTGTFAEGEKVYVSSTNLSGTVSGSAGGYTITGSGTSFQSQVAVGDYVKFAGEIKLHKIADITSNTVMTLETPLINAITATTYFNTVVGKVMYQTLTNPATIVLEASNARYVDGINDVVFTSGDTIVGETTGVSATILTVDDQNVSYMQPSIFRSNFTKTSTTAALTSPIAKDIGFNTNNYMTDANLVVKSRSNEVRDNNGARDFKLRVSMESLGSTQGTGIRATSPLIDYDISNVMVYEYLINNDATDENTYSGSATTKYVSRTVELKDGMDAEDLKVFLTTYKPSGADIQVYARLQSQYDNRNFDFIEWTPLLAKPETDQYSSSSNRYDFREIEYALPTVAKSAGQGAWLDTASDTIRYIADNGSEYNDFKKFAIKIVLLSPNHYAVPRVRDLRAIALS